MLRAYARKNYATVEINRASDMEDVFDLQSQHDLRKCTAQCEYFHLHRH